MNDLMIYEGWVSHSRLTPVKHEFKYNTFQIWVDVKRLRALDNISRWWSSKRFNLVQFKRQNYLPSDESLYDQVRNTIKAHADDTFDGDVYLLANLSYWGVCFNPIIFIACYEGEELRYLLTEVHNTPWNQRFIYLHDIQSKETDIDERGYHIANFDKAFHVSPFMPMDLQYRWKYRIDNTQFFIKMHLSKNDESIFNVTMNLKGKPLSQRQANFIPFRFPLTCIKVVAAIYWQAILLWLKRVPFIPHPK